MRIIAYVGREDIAMAYIAQLSEGRALEMVESVQPPYPREHKWVVIVSSLYGCPVGCPMCDAGGGYKGRLTKDEIFAQIDYLVQRRFPDGVIPCAKFKVQFARMGEPAMNPAVLEALEELPRRYHAPGLLPSLSTIGPRGREAFFERLLDIKDRLYSGGRFQLQFSLHTTDPEARARLIPVSHWSFREIAAYGERFHRDGDRKVTLNFALAREMPLDASALADVFAPSRFLVKVTPLNPTHRSREGGLTSYIDPYRPDGEYTVLDKLRERGFEVLLSIGEAEENHIGSNCGQYLMKHLRAGEGLSGGYEYCEGLGE